MAPSVVLLSDTVDARSTITFEQRDLEMAVPEYFRELFDGLGHVSASCVHYADPRAFLDRIASHRDDTVVSIWSGVGSRSRRALVPAICEAYGIRYVGADAYTQITCQDKFLAKQMAQRFGLRSPAGILFQSDADADRILALRLPLVVKPNFEGGSIGISQGSLVQDHEQALQAARRTLRVYREPVLVEEFVGGREVSVVIAGRPECPAVLQMVEIEIEGAPFDLRDRLFGYELKKLEPYPIRCNALPEAMTPELSHAVRSLYASFDKVDVLRVDGRLTDDGFVLVELSPDVHLGADSTVARGFAAAGLDYHAMLRSLLELAR